MTSFKNKSDIMAHMFKDFKTKQSKIALGMRFE